MTALRISLLSSAFVTLSLLIGCAPPPDTNPLERETITATHVGTYQSPGQTAVPPTGNQGVPSYGTIPSIPGPTAPAPVPTPTPTPAPPNCNGPRYCYAAVTTPPLGPNQDVYQNYSMDTCGVPRWCHGAKCDVTTGQCASTCAYTSNCVDGSSCIDSNVCSIPSPSPVPFPSLAPGPGCFMTVTCAPEPGNTTAVYSGCGATAILEDCGLYACDAQRGGCLKTCQVAADCSDGKGKTPAAVCASGGVCKS